MVSILNPRPNPWRLIETHRQGGIGQIGSGVKSITGTVAIARIPMVCLTAGGFIPEASPLLYLVLSTDYTGVFDTEWYAPHNEQTTCDSDQDVSGHSIKSKGKDPVRYNDDEDPHALAAIEAARGYHINTYNSNEVSAAATDGEVQELDPRA